MQKGLEISRVHGPVLLKSPLDDCKSSSIFLSNIEQKMCFHARGLCVYSTSKAFILDKFQKALTEALVPYYFVAGRIKVNEEERRIELNPNNEGVLFAGAICESHSISQLDDLRKPRHAYRKLIVYPENLTDLSQVPLLTVQVTTFTCGGFVLGVSHNHAIFDAISFNDFLKVVVQLMRGESLSKLHKLNMDRTVLRARQTPLPPDEHNQLFVFPDVPARILFKQAMSAPGRTKLSYGTFSFNPNMLRSLKSQALADGTISRCSTFEALAAHIWRSRVQALNEGDLNNDINRNSNSSAKLCIMLNLRNRLRELGRDFCGNAAFPATCTDLTPGQVIQKPFSFCVRKIQESIKRVNPDHIHSSLDLWEVCDNFANMGEGMIITEWSSGGYHKLDFGWGMPNYVTAEMSDFTGMVMIVSNCRGDGGLDVLMAMEPTRMHILKKYITDTGSKCRL